MSQEKAEALVLRGVDFSETSRIITFLSPERGLLTCIAKGVRRKGSPLASVLDTFNHVELVYYWKEGRGVHTLGEASLLHAFPGIKRNLERCSYGAIPLELAARTAHENDAAPEFFDTLRAGLVALERWEGPPKLHCAWQLAQLLGTAGFAPELRVCVHCGGKIGHNSRFDDEGGAVCERCPGGRRIPLATIESMATLFAESTHCPDLPDEQVLFSLIRAYMIRQTETDYRSLRVIDDMFGP